MAFTLGILTTMLGGCGKTERKPEYTPADVYVGLRTQALRITADQLQFSPSAENPSVLAVLMEMGYPQAAVTLLSAADGAASLYFSNGGGIIGAGGHDAPKAASMSLVRAAENCVKHCKRVTEFPLPRQDHTRFYLVTIDGVFSDEAVTADLGNNRHRLSPLFHQAHELITQIRLMDEQRRQEPAASQPK